VLVLGYIAHHLIPYSVWGLPFWILYALVNGTIATGVWVLGHECGHGAFSDNMMANDTLGFILHSALLVPFFSWSHSHALHHAKTNHLTEGETHVPATVEEKGGRLYMKIRDFIGTDAWAIFQCSVIFLIGWFFYLIFGSTGGPKRGFTSHFIVPNQLFPKKINVVSLIIKSWIRCYDLFVVCLGSKYIFHSCVCPLPCTLFGC